MHPDPAPRGRVHLPQQTPGRSLRKTANRAAPQAPTCWPWTPKRPGVVPAQRAPCARGCTKRRSTSPRFGA